MWRKIWSLVIWQPFHPLIHHVRSLIVLCADKENRTQYCDKTISIACWKCLNAALVKIVSRQILQHYLKKVSAGRIVIQTVITCLSQISAWLCQKGNANAPPSFLTWGSAACSVSTEQPKQNCTLFLDCNCSPWQSQGWSSEPNS